MALAVSRRTSAARKFLCAVRGQWAGRCLLTCSRWPPFLVAIPMTPKPFVDNARVRRDDPRVQGTTRTPASSGEHGTKDAYAVRRGSRIARRQNTVAYDWSRSRGEVPTSCCIRRWRHRLSEGESVRQMAALGWIPRDNAALRLGASGGFRASREGITKVRSAPSVGQMPRRAHTACAGRPARFSLLRAFATRKALRSHRRSRNCSARQSSSLRSQDRRGPRSGAAWARALSCADCFFARRIA